jgi:23S rRNA (cytosine1962-C5)-methyltransferase
MSDNTTSLPILVPQVWKDYELIDSGEGAKLERFGTYIINRPDPRALWKKTAPETVWKSAHASYVRTSSEEGHWNVKTPPPTNWRVSFEDLVFTLKPTSFKHVGIFPEQAVNWQWISDLSKNYSPKVLNLFAYTGGATLAAARAGGLVTHVDSMKSTVQWAKENASASNLANKPIRWIVDDAYKFAARDTRRGSKYDGIIMDPPRFGRGTKGEVWKVEEDLPKLLSVCRQLLSDTPIFFLINTYTADLSSIVLDNLMKDLMKNFGGSITTGELAIADTTSHKLLPNGIFSRWQRTTAP